MLLFNYCKSFAQNNKEESYETIIKKNKVKSSTVYFFKNEKDSSISQSETFDAFGFMTSKNMFDSNGKVSILDTFYYDNNQVLLKKEQSYQAKKISVYAYKYDSQGKVIFQNLIHDSGNLKGHSFYDAYNRITKSVNYDNNGDSSVFKTFYNKKGLLVKNTFVSGNVQSIIKFKYNNYDKLIKKMQTDNYSEFITKYRYNDDGKLVESNFLSIYKDDEKISKTIFTYYTNGLIFDTKNIYPNKTSSFQKTYYTYY